MKRMEFATLLALSAAVSVVPAHAQDLAAGAGGATGGAASGQSCSYDDYVNALGNREATGNYQAKNSGGYLGLYQMDWQTLQEAGLATGASTSNSNIVWAPGMSEQK